MGVLSEVESLAGAWLLSCLRKFVRTDAYAAAQRLRRGTPSEVTSLAHLVLIRRLGRGGSAMVYAAVKADTGGVLALKMVDTRAKRTKMRHMLREREVGARLAALQCPYLCELRYAFQSGPWYALAMPLYPGGTLQMQLDERASPRGGLEVEEVRWLRSACTPAASCTEPRACPPNGRLHFASTCVWHERGRGRAPARVCMRPCSCHGHALGGMGSDGHKRYLPAPTWKAFVASLCPLVPLRRSVG